MDALMYGFLDELEKQASVGRFLKYQGAKFRRGTRDTSVSAERRLAGRGKTTSPKRALTDPARLAGVVAGPYTYGFRLKRNKE